VAGFVDDDEAAASFNSSARALLLKKFDIEGRDQKGKGAAGATSNQKTESEVRRRPEIVAKLLPEELPISEVLMVDVNIGRYKYCSPFDASTR
jgi:hypothetical protein